ncbi:RimJ/RimL family protein N-acetyltransferase [Friedmanniella endophytica]|uniref:RimJ/RimL family protein N-acetyltransferase n=1 Tax=Microlunatus kandeliicorticis TaxID=1759536 RepID=A0A7W3IT32_9ACTN|nr:GNAT family N-acetyltransferase [Microlunatus kandeliicorticis]MBA8794754.1 RimJ/RimL family protein N-acetyltransferase [Microlunatus kandeliicorticis]
MTTVETPRLVLRHPCLNDEEAMVDVWTDAAVARFMDDFGPRTPTQVATWLREVCRTPEPHAGDRPGAVQFSVVERTNDVCAGWLGLGESTRCVAEWDFGYALRPGRRGLGFMGEALDAAIAACRSSFGIETFWGECHASNVASAATMLAAGLTEVECGDVGSRRFVTHPDLTTGQELQEKRHRHPAILKTSVGDAGPLSHA